MEFHKRLGKPIPKKPRLADVQTEVLRLDLIEEEFDDELRGALFEGDLVAIADALADLLYVTYGCAIEYGIPIDKIFAEVHRSNMTKFKNGANFREDGKLLKGAGFEPPRIAQILEEAKHE